MMIAESDIRNAGELNGRKRVVGKQILMYL
jgi:hypothetical protein